MGIGIINTSDFSAGFSTIIQNNSIGTKDTPFPGTGIKLSKCLGAIGGLYPLDGNRIITQNQAIDINENDSGTLSIQGNEIDQAGDSDFPRISISDTGREAHIAIQRNRISGSNGISFQNQFVTDDSLTIEENHLETERSGITTTNASQLTIGNNNFNATAANNTAVTIRASMQAIPDWTHSETMVAGNTFSCSSEHRDCTAINIEGPFDLKRLTIGTETHKNNFADPIACILRGSQQVSDSSVSLIHNLAGSENIGSKETDQFSRFCGDFQDRKRIQISPLIRNVQLSRTYETIQSALDDPDCKDGNDIMLGNAVFKECLDLKKSVTILSENTSRPATIQSTNTSEGSALITLNAPSIKLSNIQLIADGNLTSNAIIANSNILRKLEIDSVSIDNCNATTPLLRGLSLDNSERNTVSIMMENCEIGALKDDSGNISEGVYLKGFTGRIGGAAANGNRFHSSRNGLVISRPLNGEVLVNGNSFADGGLVITEPDVTASVSVTNNKFNTGRDIAQAILINHNYAGSPVQVVNNEFENYFYRAILSAGSGNVSIKNNQFRCSDPSNYRRYHVELNTEWSGLRIPPYHPNSAVITGNRFLSENCSAIKLANGLKGFQQPDYASVIIGKPGEENYFANTLDGILTLDDRQGNEYVHSVDLEHNFIGNETGYSRSNSISVAQQFTIERKVIHKLDNENVGYVSWSPKKMFIAGHDDCISAVALTNALKLAKEMELTIFLEGGNYVGPTPEIDSVSTLTLIGAPELPKPELFSGLRFSGNNKNVTIENISIRGKADGATDSVVFNSGEVGNLKLFNTFITGNNTTGRHGITGGIFTGMVSINQCNFQDVLGWSLFDTSCTGAGSSLTKVDFENNQIVNCTGQIHFRNQRGDLPSPTFSVSKNQFKNGLDSVYTPLKISNFNRGLIEGNSWDGFRSERPIATIQLSNVDLATIQNNRFNNGIEALSIKDSKMNFRNNSVSNYRSVMDQQSIEMSSSSTFTNNFLNTDVLDSTFDTLPNNNWIMPTGTAIAPNTGQMVELPPGEPITTVRINDANPQFSCQAAIALSEPHSKSASKLGLLQSSSEHLGIKPDLKENLHRALLVNTSQICEDFVVTMHFGYATNEITSFTETQLYLAEWDSISESWQPAASLNQTGSKRWQGASVPLEPNTGNLGKYGIDPTNNIAWAVIDHGGVFTIRNEKGTNAIPVTLSEFQLD